MPLLQVALGETLQTNPLIALPLLFGAGVLTSLTPCIYPMIPITAGIITGTAGEEATRGRVIGLTLAYVLGLAILYALAGLLAGLSGSLFGTLASSWWAQALIALMLALFGLAMLEVVPVPVPRRLTEWAGGLGAGSFPAVFLLGATSGLVAAPCGAPAFAAVLTWVSTTQSAGLGFLYLFVFSLGMTALLVVVGIFSGSVSVLPKAGPWMRRLKKVAGFVLLAMAAWYGWHAWLAWG
jgi:thiol:disulfide interchange protein DsbD